MSLDNIIQLLAILEEEADKSRPKDPFKETGMATPNQAFFYEQWVAGTALISAAWRCFKNLEEKQ